jgi:hypothetical protein
MKNQSKYIIASLSLAMFLGCGDDEEKNKKGGMSAKTVEGKWVSDCVASGDLFEKKEISFTLKSFDFLSALYSDDGCTTIDNQISGSGEYDLGGLVDVKYVGATTAIDYTFKSYIWKFVADSSAAVDYAVACEATNVSGSVDVLGKTCNLSDQTIVFSSPAYGVVYIDGDKKLLLTDSSSNAGTEEDRSTLLRINAGWTKVEVAE